MRHNLYMRPFRIFLLCLALDSPAFAQPLVMTTSPVLQDLVRQIGGANFRVECLVPPGTRPPEFEPALEDGRRLREARLMVVNGADYEPWLEDLLKLSGYDGQIITATQGLPLLDLEGHWHEAGDDGLVDAGQSELDPYAWHDPKNVVRYVENIRAALTSLMPARAGDFRDRAASYTRELQALNDDAVKQFGAVPRDRLRLVTPLQCFHYLAAAYGLQIVPVPGLASGQDLRPAVLERMVVGIHQLHVPVVFFESTANPRTLKRISDETGTMTITSLYTDGLGPAGSPAGTCLGMLRANIDTLVRALK